MSSMRIYMTSCSDLVHDMVLERIRGEEDGTAAEIKPQ